MRDVDCFGRTPKDIVVSSLADIRDASVLMITGYLREAARYSPGDPAHTRLLRKAAKVAKRAEKDMAELDRLKAGGAL